jgi:heme/copper-type cytochrome/quinol oxidase subunit 1
MRRGRKGKIVKPSLTFLLSSSFSIGSRNFGWLTYTPLLPLSKANGPDVKRLLLLPLEFSVSSSILYMSRRRETRTCNGGSDVIGK